MDEKKQLREHLRRLRRHHVASQPEGVRALMFHRPPSSVAAMARPGSVIGFYASQADEAPTGAYAGWFHERGHPLALPWFPDKGSPMQFRAWNDPFDDRELAPGPFRIMQPRESSADVVPDVLFVPLIGFTADRERLGQGGGHYDRWLAAHPDTFAIGLAWDCQLVDSLPLERHDHHLHMVITPTRLYAGEKVQ